LKGLKRLKRIIGSKRNEDLRSEERGEKDGSVSQFKKFKKVEGV
jgi:hypothetical protein